VSAGFGRNFLKKGEKKRELKKKKPAGSREEKYWNKRAGRGFWGLNFCKSHGRKVGGKKDFQVVRIYLEKLILRYLRNR